MATVKVHLLIPDQDRGPADPENAPRRGTRGPAKFRVVYTNGPVAQESVEIQTILDRLPEEK